MVNRVREVGKGAVDDFDFLSEPKRDVRFCIIIKLDIYDSCEQIFAWASFDGLRGVGLESLKFS